MSRVIFHIDVNSAFLSWTAVKIVREGGQDIRLVPSVVSGDPGDRRSIIAAASMPAKKLGIRAAMPVTMALRKCPQLVIVHGDWEWYKRCSEGFIAICRSYSPVLQQFSIDECFLDMSLRCGSRDPVEVAMRLKDEIKSRLGFTVNVGVGPNKPPGEDGLGLREAGQGPYPLGARDPREDVAAGCAGPALGREEDRGTAHRLRHPHDRGPGTTQRGPAHPPRGDIDRALFNVACIVAHRIRRDGFRASTVSMFVKYTDFSVAQKQCQTGQPTDITAVILNEARRKLAEVWDGVTPLRQVGLGVSKLTHETIEQMSLFEDPKMEYYREWDRQYDAARAQSEDARLLAYERKNPSDPAVANVEGKAYLCDADHLSENNLQDEI